MTSEGMGARKGIRFGGYWERMGYAKENMAYLVCGGGRRWRRGRRWEDAKRKEGSSVRRFILHPSHRTTSECFFFFFYQFYIFTGYGIH